MKRRSGVINQWRPVGSIYKSKLSGALSSLHVKYLILIKRKWGVYFRWGMNPLVFGKVVEYFMF